MSKKDKGGQDRCGLEKLRERNVCFCKIRHGKNQNMEEREGTFLVTLTTKQKYGARSEHQICRVYIFSLKYS